MTVPDAVLERLRTAVMPVYDGEVPLDGQGRPVAQRYAVFFAAPGTRTAEDLARVADRYVFRWRVTSVGVDRTQALWVADRCIGAVLDAPLAVEGWELGAVEHRSSSDARPDEDIPGAPLFYAVDTFELPATR